MVSPVIGAGSQMSMRQQGLREWLQFYDAGMGAHYPQQHGLHDRETFRYFWHVFYSHSPQMFISAFVSFILYSLVFLRMRGNIVVNGWYMRFRFARNEDWRGRDFAGDSALAIAKQMLLYVAFFLSQMID